jgi:hypothetical protein
VASRFFVGMPDWPLSDMTGNHLHVIEVIVFEVISRPSLDVVAHVGAAIQGRRHTAITQRIIEGARPGVSDPGDLCKMAIKELMVP